MSTRLGFLSIKQTKQSKITAAVGNLIARPLSLKARVAYEN